MSILRAKIPSSHGGTCTHGPEIIRILWGAMPLVRSFLTGRPRRKSSFGEIQMTRYFCDGRGLIHRWAKGWRPRHCFGAGGAGTARESSEDRSLHQRRSGHHESLPAWRGLRDRRRGGDRSGPGLLRALHARSADEVEQRQHGADLPEGARAGAGRGLSGADRADDSPYHRRDQEPNPSGGGPTGNGYSYRGNRRDGRGHRRHSLSGSDPAIRPGRGPQERALHSPDPGAPGGSRGGDENETDAA